MFLKNRKGNKIIMHTNHPSNITCTLRTSYRKVNLRSFIPFTWSRYPRSAFMHRLLRGHAGILFTKQNENRA